jgi:hypothetical protein
VSWVKYDDQFPDHPKLAALGDLGPLAGWLHVAATCYCSRHLTDGFLPSGALSRLATFPRRVQASDLAAALVRVGLWEQAEDGYRVHDYLDYNPSREQVERKRAEWADRQRKSRGESRGDSGSDTGVTPPRVTRDSASPVPVPLSRSASEEAHTSRDGLPNLSPEAIEALERATGSTAYAAGDKQLQEFDRLVGTHGLDAVARAFDGIRKGKAMTARQLVWGAVKVLEPIPDGKQAATAEREQANAAAGDRRVLQTLKQNHALGGHQKPHPRCPLCQEAAA